MLTVCCDGLPEAIEVTWAQATVQTYVVHLIRVAMRFVGYGDHEAVAAALRLIYAAANAKAAREELGISPARTGARSTPRTRSSR